MKNLLTSLKKLGKKMTGSDVTGGDLVTVVDQIADGYTGGGGSGGGGSSTILLVADEAHHTATDSDSEHTVKYTFTQDITYQELIDHIYNGDIVAIKLFAGIEVVNEGQTLRQEQNIIRYIQSPKMTSFYVDGELQAIEFILYFGDDLFYSILYDGNIEDARVTFVELGTIEQLSQPVLLEATYSKNK